MANLDTTNKRRSATGVQGLFTIPAVPDGTIAALDREQATYIYAGIAAGSAVVVTTRIRRGLLLGVYP